MNLPSEGTRINLAGHLGTIKFVGPVDNTSGIWLGIEWDDPQRGRHDGIKDDKRYFTCRNQNAGSFIRPSANISYGKSFLEALTSKYIETLHGSASQENVLLGSSRGAIVVEAVRLDKVRGKLASLERLREVSLDNESLARSDPVGAIQRVCENIRGLDLSMNLLPSWDVVAMIARELPALQRLALNRNRLQPATDHSAMTAAFTGLTELQLNGTLMTWLDMQAAIVDMPNLRLVEMGYNRLASLSTPDAYLPGNRALQVINLDSNVCSEWVHVCNSLLQYASLERVILTSNCIDAIPLPEETQHLLFSLKHMALSFNKLNAWGDVDALSSWCPGLETLSLGGNPLMDREIARHTRPFTIAKIPSLLVLDGAFISPKERTDSEIFYLSQVMQHIASEEERVQAHPQWLNLCSKHGRPNEAVNSQASEDKLCNHLIALELYENTRPVFDLAQVQALLKTFEPITFHVLPTMSLRTLRMKTRKATKRKADMVLWLKINDGTFRELHADEDNRELGWLGLENGSSLVFSML